MTDQFNDVQKLENYAVFRLNERRYDLSSMLESPSDQSTANFAKRPSFPEKPFKLRRFTEDFYSGTQDFDISPPLFFWFVFLYPQDFSSASSTTHRHSLKKPAPDTRSTATFNLHLLATKRFLPKKNLIKQRHLLHIEIRVCFFPDIFLSGFFCSSLFYFTLLCFILSLCVYFGICVSGISDLLFSVRYLLKVSPPTLGWSVTFKRFMGALFKFLSFLSSWNVNDVFTVIFTLVKI